MGESGAPGAHPAALSGALGLRGLLRSPGCGSCFKKSAQRLGARARRPGDVWERRGASPAGGGGARSGVVDFWQGRAAA